jgi:mono/diheme cytochrome c family protein
MTAGPLIRLIATFIFLLPLIPAAAQSQGLSKPSYTAAQAQRGGQVYKERCSGCHGADLSGGEGDGAPALAGAPFAAHYGGGGLDQPFNHMMEAMPLDAPGSLPPETYADLLAFILEQNGVPAGTAELPSDPDKLKTMAAPNGK